MKKPDVIVLGSGPNGLAAALALGGYRLHRPLNVLVLDARDPQQFPADSRGTALTQATQLMFKALGVWETLQPHAEEVRDVKVTDSSGSTDGRPTLLAFATDTAHQAAASIVENQHLNAALLGAVRQSPGIQLQGGFSFAELEVATGGVTVCAIDGSVHRAKLLIAADGRNSPVREKLKLKFTSHDYGQTALSFSIHHSLPHQGTAEEHFSPTGVFAVLPLPGDRSSIVWGTTPQEAQRLMHLTEEEFNEALQEHMGKHLGDVKLEGKRGAFPLIKQIVEQFITSRVALIGDAAHAIHPLAGLGLNLGFKDVAALADAVAQAFARGEDIGGPAVLERYQQARRFDTMLTSMAMDSMNGLFVNDHPVLKPLRDAGLKLVDKMPAAKSFFMGQAAGVSQDNPRLLQGLLPG